MLAPGFVNTVNGAMSACFFVAIVPSVVGFCLLEGGLLHKASWHSHRFSTRLGDFGGIMLLVLFSVESNMSALCCYAFRLSFSFEFGTQNSSRAMPRLSPK
eukprot:1705988-Amphidinium_carterae.1